VGARTTVADGVSRLTAPMMDHHLNGGRRRLVGDKVLYKTSRNNNKRRILGSRLPMSEQQKASKQWVCASG
jgi:hypothetical protein